MKRIISLITAIIALAISPLDIIADTIEVTTDNIPNPTESTIDKSDDDWINEGRKKGIMMSFNLGANFNTGSNGEQIIFPERPDAATQFNWLIHYSFVPHWSAYIDFGLSFYRLKSLSISESITTALVEIFMPGIGRMRPSAAIGVAYTVNARRWQFMPRAGFGWMSVWSSERSRNHNGYEIRSKYNISPPFFNPAISVGYRTSKLCSLMLDISYRCPLKATTATITTTKDGVSDVQKFKTHGWGNDLSVSLGLMLQMNL